MQCPSTGCGDPICAHGCFRGYESLVRNLVYHITRSPNDVDDLVQEVFIKAYQSLDHFRGGSFRAYLARIARNQCFDWIRRKKAKRALTYVELLEDVWEAPGAGPEEQVLQQELAEELKSVLADMGEPDREILLLRHVHEFSYEEIAAAVSMSEGAVRTRVSRARKKLMASLDRRDLGEPPQLG